MTIKLTCIGKTNAEYLKNGMDVYLKRMKKYINFKFEYINDVKNAKNLSKQELKKKEGLLLAAKMENSDFVILLDENGTEFTSNQFATQIQKLLLNSSKSIHFIIGGAYGFSEDVYKRSNKKIALSQMTFSHQMVRLIFVEQLYRAFSILNNEPYHHN